MKTRREYCEKPTECPACSSKRVMCAPDVEFSDDSREIHQENWCEDCGLRWIDIFEIRDFQIED